jgi:hypothetical protein
MSEKLAFIIASSPSIKVVASDAGSEWMRVPFFQRFWWLYVVVTVNKNGGFTPGSIPTCIDDWVALCRKNVDMFETNTLEMRGKPRSAPP